MKLLAFADLHGQLPSLEAFIRLEAHNKYDAILAAGDIGAPGESNLSTADVVARLSVFSCPVLFVIGNSDSGYQQPIGDWPQNGTLLNENPFFFGEYAVIGLNGIFDVSAQTSRTDQKYSSKKFQMLSDSVNKHGINPRRLIILTHERMYNLGEHFPESPPLAYLFGHHHYPLHTCTQKTNYLNCSALDNNRNRWGAGCYWVVEIKGERFTAIPKPLQRPSRIGWLSGGPGKRKQQIKVFNQLYPDLALKEPFDVHWHTPMDTEVLDGVMFTRD